MKQCISKLKQCISKLKQCICIIIKTLNLLYNSSKIIFILCITLNFLSGLLAPINLLIWKHIIDYISILLTGNISIINKILKYFLFYFIVSLIEKFINQISFNLQETFGEYVDKNLTNKILTKVEQLELSCFDHSDIYNMIQKSSKESFNRSLNILNTLMRLIKNISSLSGVFILILLFSKVCLLICIISIIPIFYMNNKIMNKWYKVYEKRFEKIRFADSLKNLCIQYDSIKELRIFNSTKYIKSVILNIYEENIKTNKNIRNNFLIKLSAINIIDLLFTYIIKGIIIYVSFTRKLTIGSLITYIQSVDLLKSSLNNIMSLISNAYEGSLYMKSFFDLLSIEVDQEETKKIFNPIFNKIEFINVSFKYPQTDKYVIKNFNYIFKSNQTYGLVGLNGSGKTTLIKLFLGLYDVTSGTILFDGVDIKNINKKSLYEHVSAIFQDFIKYPFDIRTNILVGNNNLNITDETLDEMTYFTGASEFINRLPYRYDTKLVKGWSNSIELSLGQWQKIAITRAALKPSSILVLDEPTASIDALTEFNMFNNFRFLKENKLCILVTHRLSSIKIVDEILVLENGILKESGNHNELIENNGLYKKLYDMQASSYKIDTCDS